MKPYFSFALTAVIVLIISGAADGVGAQTAKPAGTPSPSGSGIVTILDVQIRLNLLGYDVGRPDGVLGSRTRAATRAFQSDRDRPATGILDYEEVTILYRLTDPMLEPRGGTAGASAAENPTAEVPVNTGSQPIPCLGDEIWCKTYRTERAGNIAIDAVSQQVGVSEVPGLADYVRRNYPEPEIDPDDINVLLVDLNEAKDGNQEVILELSGLNYCGTGGCNYEILARDPQGNLVRLLEPALSYGVALTAGYRNGYRNIILGGRVMREGAGWAATWPLFAFDGRKYVSAGQ